MSIKKAEITQDDDGSYEDDNKDIAWYIKHIRKSADHDEKSRELYYAVSHQDTPPYSRWVGTWILKCIKECFSAPQKVDVLLASFALLPGYTLRASTIENRLKQYVKDSDYLLGFLNEPGRSFDEVINNPGNKEKIKKATDSLARTERGYVQELIKYIEGLPNPREHIKDLDEYGTVKNEHGKKIYIPLRQKINCPKPAFFHLWMV